MAESYYKWDPTKFSVHVEQMDNEHIKLIEYMNNLHVKHESKAPRQEVQKALKDLGAYTVKHFQDEENLFMKLNDYALKEAHKKIHKDLLSKFTTHAENFEKTGTLTPEFFTFLKVWLMAHIAGVDMKYGEVYNKKAA